MINKNDLMYIRAGSPEDEAFIYSTFLRGLYHGDSWLSEMPKNLFMLNYHKVIEYVLTNPDTKINVCCLKEDPSAILGYAIYNSKGLIYCFVKKSWRGIHIATQLVPKDIRVAAHCTRLGLSIMKKKQWDFNPFII